MPEPVAIAVIDRVEGGVAVVEVSLPPFQATEMVEIPAKYFGGREGYIYVHNGRRWSRSRKMERAAMADAVANRPVDTTGGGDVTIMNPPHNPNRPPAPSRTSFPGNFLVDINSLSWAAVAKKWNMTEQRAQDLEKQLRAQGFKRENF